MAWFRSRPATELKVVTVVEDRLSTTGLWPHLRLNWHRRRLNWHYPDSFTTISKFANVNLCFFKHWLSNPVTVGAVAPSSRYLADAMTEDVAAFDAIVEVGAGTGAITEALVQKNPSARLILFELAEDLATKLKKRYPQAEVVAGPFHEKASVLTGLPERTIFVSGLPFRSLPSRMIALTINTLAEALRVSPARKLVQFTYQPRVPFTPPAGFLWKRYKTVWRNTPPASVWHLMQHQSRQDKQHPVRAF
jgi:phosphatidylethanolamine/phosphatidyl-N-methylethanolamine N-methyltransferase